MLLRMSMMPFGEESLMFPFSKTILENVGDVLILAIAIISYSLI